MALGVEP